VKDFGKSDDPRVQLQLDRLAALSVPQGRLGLETITTLMERLGNPHRKLPPTFHVAGTNGKGSVCAFLRAMLEAEGYKVHVTTSPHLVRYNERIRIAGELISDAMLAELLAEVLDVGSDLNPSFFEVTVAAAFLAFSREPADACVVEVGLGGRFDATNVLEPDVLAACGIAALGIDHERFLLAPEEGVPEVPIARIAFEKAGIAKPGVPLVTLHYPVEASAEIERIAANRDTPLSMRGRAWKAEVAQAGLLYADDQGSLDLPLPSLSGPHQPINAALAAAMLRHQDAIAITGDAIGKGVLTAQWPARLQRLRPGPLTGARDVWLDGGHNPNAAAILAEHFSGQKLHLVVGMIAGKDPGGFMQILSDITESITVVPVPTHEWFGPGNFGPQSKFAEDVPTALAAIPDDGLPVLITGSLYLAGEVLRLNDEIPD